MRVGVVTAIKPQERRVALTPAGAQELVASGHEVLVERTAGGGSRFPDQDFESAGARIVGSAEEVWSTSELLLQGADRVGVSVDASGSDAVHLLAIAN